MDDEGGKTDRSARPVRFRWNEDQALVRLLNGLCYPSRLLLQVNVLPAQAKNLAQARAGPEAEDREYLKIGAGHGF
jgi:hypothetical protein